MFPPERALLSGHRSQSYTVSHILCPVKHSSLNSLSNKNYGTPCIYIYISIFDQKATDCFRHLWAFLFHSDGCVTVTEAFFIIFTHKKYIGRYFLGDVIYIATLWSGVPVSTVVVHLYIRVCINSCCLLIHDVPLKILVERGLVMMVEGEGLMWRWQGAGGGVGQAVGLHLGQRLLDAQRGEAHTWVPVPALSH